MKSDQQLQELMNQIKTQFDIKIEKYYETSLVDKDQQNYVLLKTETSKKLLVWGQEADAQFKGESVQLKIGDVDYDVKLCPLTHENSLIMRKVFPWTGPKTVGLQTSFGAGDRIGVATPGHIRALKQYNIVPVIAQQSIREMNRTVRTSEEVMDDVTWAVFQEGYKDGFGSDADHLKTEQDIQNTFAAGFTGFTVDPSDHINNEADTLTSDDLEKAYLGVFDSPESAQEFLKKYANNEVTVKGNDRSLTLFIPEEEVKRLAVKYMTAIKHTINCYNLLKSLHGDKEFDFEMSVDETETPTTVAAHYIVANELAKAEVQCTSLAPRFIGEFQKAIDYIGDVDTFRQQLIDHVTISQHFGGYKISIHSGSDKYSIFPIVGEETKGVFHEKTAGTSYLEALRIVSRHDTKLFREIAVFAREKFEKERFSYHVTTDMKKVPTVDQLTDAQLESMLNEDDARQVLHITFGGTLTEKDANGNYIFRNRILDVLHKQEEEHYNVLETLFIKHIEAFGVTKK